MKWRGRRQSTNVVDRRGARGGGLGGMRLGNIRFPSTGSGSGGRGGMGIGGLLVVIVIFGAIYLFSGGDLGLGDGQGNLLENTELTDDPAQFVATVLAETEDTWAAIFANFGADYEEPTLVLFTGSTNSACGFASAAIGPFYCPADRQIYIDLAFYDELARRFGAPGDFAQAYVIAHEVGHHVQELLGLLDGNRAAAGGFDENFVSIQTELQADCFAGVWAFYARAEGLLEVGDLEEALNAAAQIGDDAIQRREQGYIVPESFNHGTSEQRARWFTIGYQTGDPGACDTFGAGRL